jgi:hypothetical protein
MGEGLEPVEVGKELADHARHGKHGDAQGSDRVITILEAAMLAFVAVLAAWSGFASAKWGTESSLKLASASAARTQASRSNLTAMENRNFDSLTFNAWLAAYASHDQDAVTVTERRFRPEFRPAFDAWMATDPFNNPSAPPGPTYMAEYKQPDADHATELDAQAEGLYQQGADAGETADGYVRTTVFLATVLFLVGISGHFRVRAARIGLIATGGAILTFAIVLLIAAPRPP